MLFYLPGDGEIPLCGLCVSCAAYTEPVCSYAACAPVRGMPARVASLSVTIRGETASTGLESHPHSSQVDASCRTFHCVRPNFSDISRSLNAPPNSSMAYCTIARSVSVKAEATSTRELFGQLASSASGMQKTCRGRYCPFMRITPRPFGSLRVTHFPQRVLSRTTSPLVSSETLSEMRVVMRPLNSRLTPLPRL